MANDSLAHHLLLPFAAGCSDDDEYAGPATVAFPAFWPPFPPLSSDSDSDAPNSFVAPPRMDHRTRSRDTAASAFFGLGFHDVDDDEWAPPDEGGGGEVELPLCWDCLQLEDHVDDHHHQLWASGVSDADEWEQVAGREEDATAAVRGLEWEVLQATNTNSLGSLALDDADDDIDIDAGIETFFLDEADDVLFGQLAADHEPPPGKGGRPAAKAAVEGLPTVVVVDGDAQCAVCKEGVERARRLPCAHTSTTTGASCPGSPSATRARSAATSCPPMTPSTRGGRPGGPPAARWASVARRQVRLLRPDTLRNG
ncbi:hypothetical protein PR202_gb09673 [Eleusine coracana subsp. coracana]|uniref:Uncharacterized protein n=1 Tax=Eleusine coracana subsp. coracana TaxID=191504 RepID=A0AAV5EIN0_ELECO|nr:hypothetical protein PR202_gb09673 [Eleusine coracana subsp. coracana]